MKHEIKLFHAACEVLVNALSDTTKAQIIDKLAAIECILLMEEIENGKNVNTNERI